MKTGAGPTEAELAAVRKVLYQAARAQRISDDAASFSVLLNIEDQDPDRLVVWWVPATGKLGPSVVEAAKRCAGIASAYQEMSDEVGELDINGPDKAAVRSTLEAVAAWWSARAAALADPKPADDPAAVAQGIKAHLVRAYHYGHSVAAYFQPAAT